MQPQIEVILALAFVPFFPFGGKKMALKFRIWRSRPDLHAAQTDQWEALMNKVEKKFLFFYQNG